MIHLTFAQRYCSAVTPFPCTIVRSRSCRKDMFIYSKKPSTHRGVTDLLPVYPSEDFHSLFWREICTDNSGHAKKQHRRRAK